LDEAQLNVLNKRQGGGSNRASRLAIKPKGSLPPIQVQRP
jgi:hypothetical protein